MLTKKIDVFLVVAVVARRPLFVIYIYTNVTVKKVDEGLKSR